MTPSTQKTVLALLAAIGFVSWLTTETIFNPLVKAETRSDASASASTPANVPTVSPTFLHTDVFGQTLHYLEAGTGPVVVLLHGLGADATQWTQTIPHLATHFRVIAPDQIGFGRSDKPLIPYRPMTLVEFLHEFLTVLGIEKATLVGNSLGGWTAALFAATYPDRVDKIVLVAPAGISPATWQGPPINRDLLALLNPSTRTDFAKLLRLLLHNEAVLNDAFIHEHFTTKLRFGDGYTITQFLDAFERGADLLDDVLRGINAPTAVFWGREDELTPLAMSAVFIERIPNTQGVIFEQCGHLPQVDCPENFNKALRAFLGIQ